MKKKNTGPMLLVGVILLGFVAYNMMDGHSGCSTCKGCSKGCGKCKGCSKGCGKCKGCNR